ncbi:hypothetical protein HZB94_04300 [Candidatus Falkowbacteria bacterium]|nr:hypothetical protein [Candidatus Falkowbacteria bacterium]
MLTIVENISSYEYFEGAGADYYFRKVTILVETNPNEDVAISTICAYLQSWNTFNGVDIDWTAIIAQNPDANFFEEEGVWYAEKNNFLLFTWASGERLTEGGGDNNNLLRQQDAPRRVLFHCA